MIWRRGRETQRRRVWLPVHREGRRRRGVRRPLAPLYLSSRYPKSMPLPTIVSKPRPHWSFSQGQGQDCTTTRTSGLIRIPEIPAGFHTATMGWTSTVMRYPSARDSTTTLPALSRSSRYSNCRRRTRSDRSRALPGPVRPEIRCRHRCGYAFARFTGPRESGYTNGSPPGTTASGPGEEMWI